MATFALTYIALPSGPIKLAMTSVLISTLVIGVSRMNLFYYKTCKDDDPNSCTYVLRDFGPSDHESMFPAWMAIAAVGYLVYIMAMVGDMSKNQ